MKRQKKRDNWGSRLGVIMAVAFLEDKFDINRKKAVLIFGIISFILCQPAIFFLKNGVVDELDFWG